MTWRRPKRRERGRVGTPRGHRVDAKRRQICYSPPMRAVLFALLLTTSLAAPAAAHKSFARKEGVKCKECHVATEGGGPRTLIGQYYQATKTLPIDRSEAGMKLVNDTVQRWMQDLLSVPPVIRWRHVPLDETPSAAPLPHAPARDDVLLRRLSLDLRGTSPRPEELDRLVKGKTSIDEFVDEFLASKDFSSTFFLYHKDIIRPRTGIFNTPVSFSKVSATRVDGVEVWSSDALRGEVQSGACAKEATVQVSPWWKRSTTLNVCSKSASTATVVKGPRGELRCDSDEGQRSGLCGCGAHLRYCYVDGLREPVKDSMRNEMATVAMEIVDNDLPYGQILTADWSMLDGVLEVHYAKLWGTLNTLQDPDASKPWRRIDRGAHHAGVLSSPPMLNFFYNGRRWAQRTYEAFMCHDTVPDWDLLDDAIDGGENVVVPYRDSPDLLPTATVTEGRACAACHIQLDGLARVKDRWGYFGDYNETMPKLGMPIPQSAMFLGQEVDGLNGFGQALSSSEVFEDCTVNQAWEHFFQHRFRPDENATRRALVKGFRAHGQSFRWLVKAITSTPEYRAQDNLKLMDRELYRRAMGRATDVAWKVGTKIGWDVYYDKVGGMDYRKIEFRDRRPGLGHSLVQFKGAAESCQEFVTREEKRNSEKRLWLSAVSLEQKPDDKAFDKALARLYVRALARPYNQVSTDERKIMRNLFDRVASDRSPADGWRAVCTAIFASEDYALF